jgi:hypothetical protein
MDPLLTRPVHVAGGDKPFGELTRPEVEARAAELREAVGFGPTMRVAPVARAWADLAREMDQAEAATVADLEAEIVHALAQPLWIAPEL